MRRPTPQNLNFEGAIVYKGCYGETSEGITKIVAKYRNET